MFEVRECAFDAVRLRQQLEGELALAGAQVALGVEAVGIRSFVREDHSIGCGAISRSRWNGNWGRSSCHQPVTVRDVARSAFGREFDNRLQGEPVRYDMHTRHASLLGALPGPYLESRDEVLAGIARFVKAERATH